MDLIIPKFINYQLYLLQLENYELGRYWKLLRQKGFFPSKDRPQRKELVWTAKARALLVMAVGLHVLIVIVLAAATATVIHPGLDNLVTGIVLGWLVLLPFYFVWFSLALIAIRPLDERAKHQLIQQAQAKLASLPQLQIIGIAGSYGKTTTKEVLKAVLSAKYSVLSPPESVNTPVGIARFILNKVGDDTKILVLELGEHYRGDIKQLCQIAPPDVAVLTGINEAHLERMKTLDNITATIFEAAEFAKPGAMVLLNGDDERIVSHYKEYTGDREVRFYGSGSDPEPSGTGRSRTDYFISDQKFDPAKLSWNFKVQNHGEFDVALLGEYAIGSCVAALAVGEHLGLSAADIKIGLVQVRPVEHRLEPIRSGSGVLVIDDSYNGNPAGAAEAIKVLSRFENHRKIYITPGLVEIGSATAEVHRQIGRQLAKVADVVILIKDSVTPFIEQGIVEAADKKIEHQAPKVSVMERPKILWFPTALDMHESLKNIVEPDDVVLFQNDWGDQYI